MISMKTKLKKIKKKKTKKTKKNKKINKKKIINNISKKIKK